MIAPATDLHILLLAAGCASRFGSAKQGARVEGIAMVRRAALAALATGAGLSVVTGAWVETVTAELSGLPLQLLHNADWEQGLGSSIACGTRALLQVAVRPEALIVTLADQPLVDMAALRRLIAAHRRAPKRIVAADHGSTRGPPCLFPQRYFVELAALQGAQGAKPLLQRHAHAVDVVPMPEAELDIDTPADYQRLLATAHGAALPSSLH
jgi:molybdenum cofactor cytidylyltransferase